MNPTSLFPFSEGRLRPLNEAVAKHEIVSWLRQIAGSAHSLRDEETSRHRSSELVTRFLSHAEPCGFRLSLLATGTPAAPRFVGNWSWHQQGVKLWIPDASDREQARLLACAALSRDEILKNRISPHPLRNAA